MNQSPVPAPRFDRNTLLYWAGLCLLFGGIWLRYGLSLALIMIGALLTGVSVATSFFVTWLSSKEK